MGSLTDAGLNYFSFSSLLVSYPSRIRRPDKNKDRTATAIQYQTPSESNAISATFAFISTAIETPTATDMLCDSNQDDCAPLSLSFELSDDI